VYNKYSKKAMMWLLQMEQEDEVKIMHGRNVREYKVPELHHLSVDGYCPEAKTIYLFNGCFHHGHSVSRSVTSPPGVAIRYLNVTSGRCLVSNR